MLIDAAWTLGIALALYCAICKGLDLIKLVINFGKLALDVLNWITLPQDIWNAFKEWWK